MRHNEQNGAIPHLQAAASACGGRLKMRNRPILGICAALSIATAGAAERATKPLCDEDNGGVALPPGFCALVAADGIGAPRDLTVAPNGDVYVAIDGADGGIAALRDADGDGRLEEVEHFGSGGGSGVQYHDEHLYFASDLFILRYPLLGGLLVPRAAPEIILTAVSYTHLTLPTILRV